jgi:hypothetical protein
MTWYGYVINAAKQSRHNARHWFCYLRKVIFEDCTYLTDEDIEKLLTSDELTAFQKVSLEFAVQQGSPTHEHVVSLNKPANVDEIRQLIVQLERIGKTT